MSCNVAHSPGSCCHFGQTEYVGDMEWATGGLKRWLKKIGARVGEKVGGGVPE